MQKLSGMVVGNRKNLKPIIVLRNLFSILLVLIFVSGLSAQGIPKSSKDSLIKYINFLGADKLQGRGTGSAGLKKAGQFIVNNLKNWHIQHAGDNNSYFQKIPLHASQPQTKSTLQLSFPNKTLHLLINEQFLLIKSGVETLIPVPEEVVFAGYGINAPEYDYNDYRQIDVLGKIVVLLDGEPYSKTDSNFFGGATKTLYSFPESKIRTAFANGAIGTIIVPSNYSDSTSTWERMQIEYSFEDVTLPQRSSSHLAVFLSRDSAQLLFQSSEVSYQKILEQEKLHLLVPFEMNLKIAFSGQFKQKEFKSSNIVSVIPGSDARLKNEYLVIGAHYDHLGIGKTVQNDSIYNGVMDNAVGSAVVLELARMFASLELSPRRSLIIVFFTGEEKGLLGSEYYTRHPYSTTNQTIAMINVDGLAALGRFKSLIGVGASYSSLGNILNEAAAEHGYKIEQIRNENIDHIYSKSDQLSFARKGIPSILITEGYEYKNLSHENVLNLTKKWFRNIYHTPFDDLNQPIDYHSIQNYTDFIFAYVNRLLNTSQVIDWHNGVPYKSKRLQSRAGQ